MILGLAVALTAVMRQRERAASERDQARTVLENAIEAMADGFVIWDQNDRLVTCNARYRELYARIAPIMKPGVSYRDVLAYGVQSGQYPEADGRVDQFLSHTMAWHRSDGGALERSLPDGTWLLITGPAHGGRLRGRHADRHHGRQDGPERPRGRPRPGQGRDDRGAAAEHRPDRAGGSTREPVSPLRRGSQQHVARFADGRCRTEAHRLQQALSGTSSTSRPRGRRP